MVCLGFEPGPQMVGAEESTELWVLGLLRRQKAIRRSNGLGLELEFI